MNEHLKSDHQKSVEEFMVKARNVLPDKPTMPDEKTRLLRAKLILEECLETIEALGFEVAKEAYGKTEFIYAYTPDLVEIADGVCDINVVACGTLSACGLPDLPFQNAVNENNLAKFKEGFSWREDGKLIKPSNHQPPDIKGILDGLSEETKPDQAETNNFGYNGGKWPSRSCSVDKDGFPYEYGDNQ